MKLKLGIFFLILLSTINSYPAKATPTIHLSSNIPLGAAGSVPMYSQAAHSLDGSVQGIMYVSGDGIQLKTLTGLFSTDYGQTWSQPKVFSTSTGWRRFNLSISQDGTQVTLAWAEETRTWHPDAHNLEQVFISQSFDSGKSWRPTHEIFRKTGWNDCICKIVLNENPNGFSKILSIENHNNDTDATEIYMAFSKDGGLNWKTNQVVSEKGMIPIVNLGVSEDGSIMAYSYEDYGNPLHHGELVFSSSLDFGETWKPEKIISTTSTFSKEGGKILLLQKSKFILLNDNGPELLVSNDSGLTFSVKSLPPPPKGPTFNNFAFSLDGAVDTNRNAIYIVFNGISPDLKRTVSFTSTYDEGKNWTEPVMLSEVADNYPILRWSPDYNQLAILWTEWNHSIVNISLSSDSGTNWSSPTNILDEGEGFAGGNLEYETLVAPILSKGGYRFAWINSDLEKNFSLASKKIESVKLDFDLNGATNGNAPSTRILISGSSLKLPVYKNEFSKIHFKFRGWNTMPDGNGKNYSDGVDSIVTYNDTKLFASWLELPKYQITYDANGILNSEISSQSLYSDESVQIRIIPNSKVREGYKFLKWNTSPDGKGDTYEPGALRSKIENSIHLYAIGQKILKLKTIVCVKGNLSKKVTASNPMCPKGYKKK